MNLGLGLSISKGGSIVFEAESKDYFDRISANSGTISASAKVKINKFVKALKTAGLWTILREVGLFVGVTNLAACRVKLKYVSAADKFTSTGFVDGNLTPTGAAPGLQGDGSTRKLDWGATALSMLSTQYLGATIAVPTAITATAGTRYYMGSNGANGASVFNSRHSATQMVTNIYTSVSLIESSPPTAGRVYIGNHSDSEYVLYENGVSVNTNTSSAGNSSTLNHFGFCNNNNGTQQSFTDHTVALLAVADPLTAAQALSLSNIILQLLSDLAS